VGAGWAASADACYPPARFAKSAALQAAPGASRVRVTQASVATSASIVEKVLQELTDTAEAAPPPLAVDSPVAAAPASTEEAAVPAEEWPEPEHAQHDQEQLPPNRELFAMDSASPEVLTQLQGGKSPFGLSQRSPTAQRERREEHVHSGHKQSSGGGGSSVLAITLSEQHKRKRESEDGYGEHRSQSQSQSQSQSSLNSENGGSVSGRLSIGSLLKKRRESLEQSQSRSPARQQVQEQPHIPTSRSSLGVLLQLRREGKLAAPAANSRTSLPFAPNFNNGRGSGGSWSRDGHRGGSSGGAVQRFAGLGPVGRPQLGVQRPVSGAFMRR